MTFLYTRQCSCVDTDCQTVIRFKMLFHFGLQTKTSIFSDISSMSAEWRSA